MENADPAATSDSQIGGAPNPTSITEAKRLKQQ